MRPIQLIVLPWLRQQNETTDFSGSPICTCRADAGHFAFLFPTVTRDPSRMPPDAILLAGIYFSADVNDEKEIGSLADALFRQVEIVLPTVHYFVHDARLKDEGTYGFKATFNPTYPGIP